MNNKISMASCTSNNNVNNIISKVVRNCYSDLVNALATNSLVDDLFRAKCLSNEEQIRVLSLGYQHARNRELLDILMTKDDVALSVLFKHLKRYNVQLYYLMKEKNIELQSELILAEESEVAISMSSRVWFIPQNPLKNFVGRIDELNSLQTFYADFENSDRPIIISGQGGVGKSSLVMSFIYSEHVASDNHVNVIWINAASEETIQDSLLSVARVLEKEFKIIIDKEIPPCDMMQQIYRELGNCKSILVFDSADDMLALKPFLPKGMPLTLRKPTVIITTRPHPCLNSEERSIKLGVWKQDEAVEFISKVFPNSTELDCKALAEQLSSLPLALQQAVSCMNGIEKDPPKPGDSETSMIQKYLKQFESNREKLLADTRFRDCLDSDYNATAFVSWFTNLEKLLKQPNSREAVHILRFFRKRKSIKLATLKRKLRLRHTFRIRCAKYSDEGLALLIKYSLVSCGDEYIEMHKLNSYATKAFFDLVLDAGQSLPSLLINFLIFVQMAVGMIILPKSEGRLTVGVIILALASLYFLYMVSRSGYRLYRGRKLFSYAMSLHKGLMYNAIMILAIVITVGFIFLIILNVLEASLVEE